VKASFHVAGDEEDDNSGEVAEIWQFRSTISSGGGGDTIDGLGVLLSLLRFCNCSFTRAQVVPRGPFGPDFLGRFAKVHLNPVLAQFGHGSWPVHRTLRREHASQARSLAIRSR
jgi:hypothetical protein